MQSATLSPQTQQWTVLSLIEWSARHLTDHGFDEARLHVELLLAHVLSYTRLQLYTNFDRPLTPAELGAFRALFKRRLTHEPLQYILGETEFMGMPFIVNPSVLIPRPETEQLVEHVLAAIRTFEKDLVRVLDVGTGSGNIAIALGKLEPAADLTSIDVSHDALDVAMKNCERNGMTNIRLEQANVLEDFFPGEMFDVIVSNPPYISLDEFGSLSPEVKEFEPRVATTDEADGLTFIRRIAEIARTKLMPGGFLFIEIAYNQAESGRETLIKAGLREIEVFFDYANHPRILKARATS